MKPAPRFGVWSGGPSSVASTSPEASWSKEHHRHPVERVSPAAAADGLSFQPARRQAAPAAEPSTVPSLPRWLSGRGATRGALRVGLGRQAVRRGQQSHEALDIVGSERSPHQQPAELRLPEHELLTIEAVELCDGLREGGVSSNCRRGACQASSRLISSSVTGATAGASTGAVGETGSATVARSPADTREASISSPSTHRRSGPSRG